MQEATFPLFSWVLDKPQDEGTELIGSKSCWKSARWFMCGSESGAQNTVEVLERNCNYGVLFLLFDRQSFPTYSTGTLSLVLMHLRALHACIPVSLLSMSPR